MTLCKFCDGLSISLLIELTEVEFHAGDFPQQAYYQHQPSYANLIRSAKDGCRLCELILHGFQEVISPRSLSPIWEGETRDRAVSQIESQGESSDIKICINADHLFSNGNLDQVELFDVLMVQAGTPERTATSEDSDSEDNAIPPLRLALSVPRGKLIRVGKHRVGRFQLDPDLGSEHNYNVAKSWLEDCCTLHKNCPGKATVKLPTRVIDVGTLDELQGPRLFLSEDIEASYVALSHCWGGVVSQMLMTDTLETFKDVIPLSSLPANFQDAISITRHLGIQYLWIDTLCIIQDSKDDWEAESKKMGSIYRNALVTISAATACRSTDGILRCSPGSKTSRGAIPLKISTDNKSHDTVQVSLKDEEEESLGSLFSTSPLNKRGWTLQERVLSPRVLYYGKRQIYWQCRQGFRSADEVPDGALMPEQVSYPEISNLLHFHSLNQPSTGKLDLYLLLDEYYKLVHEYSSRKLSFDSDKLPAFSGLASLLHPVLGGDYLAGIWSEDFRQGLFWYDELGECRHTLSDQAPSWSWTVTNDPVLFDSTGHKGGISPDHAQLLGHNLELRNQNIYGPVHSGHLIIEGLTKKLLRSSQSINFVDEGIARVYFDEPEVGNIDETHPNLFEVEVDGERGGCLLSIVRSGYGEGERKELDMKDINFDLISEHDYIVLFLDLIPRDFDGVTATYMTCLVLMRTPDTDNSYTRVGALMSFLSYGNHYETWVKTWERKIVTII